MKRKRILSFLLAGALIMSLLPVKSLASAAPAVSVEAALLDDTVTATVNLSANSGVTNGRMVLAYDSGMLLLAEVQAGPLLAGCISDIRADTAGEVSLAWVGSSPLMQGGTLMILRFQIRGKISGASTALTLAVSEMYAGSLDVTAQVTAVGTSVFFMPMVLLEATNCSAKVTAKVYLVRGSHVTGGKILLDYDSLRLCYTSCTAAAVGMVSVSGASAENRISIAWEGSDLSSGKVLLATLEFSVIPGITKGTVVTFNPAVTRLNISETDITDTAGADPLDLTLASVPQGEFKNPYTDIDGHWAYEQILGVTKAGMFFGRTANTFVPEGKITRAEFVTVLWQMSGKPAAISEASFDDVPEGSWFSAAIKWATEKGVIHGMSEDRFAPNTNITREMMAVMLYRYAVLTGRDTGAAGDLNAFHDGAAVSSWALTQLKWAVAEGIISGSAGKLLPQDNATRAQAAVALYRYSGL